MWQGSLPDWNPNWRRRGWAILICAAVQLPESHRSSIILAVCGCPCHMWRQKQHKLPCAIIAGTDNGDGGIRQGSGRDRAIGSGERGGGLELRP